MYNGKLFACIHAYTFVCIYIRNYVSVYLTAMPVVLVFQNFHALIPYKIKLEYIIRTKTKNKDLKTTNRDHKKAV